MVKQTKTFKKGNVTKKALSAILAASMVMTSSSFVMAAPVEVEDVAVEAAAVDVVEDVDAGEENVGETITDVTVKDCTYDGTDESLVPQITVKDSLGNPVTSYTVSYYAVADEGKNKNESLADLVIGEGFGAGEYVAVIQPTGADDAGADPVERTFKVNPMEINASDITVTFGDTSSFVYNGKKQVPEIARATYSNPNASVAKTDIINDVLKNEYFRNAVLEVVAATSADNMIDAGYQNVKVGVKKEIAEYASFIIQISGYTKTTKYFIQQSNEFASACEVDEDSAVALYTGQPVAADLVVKVKGTDTVIDAKEYTVYYQNEKGQWVTTPNTNVGKHPIHIVCNGTGNYVKGNLTSDYLLASYTIRVADFTDAVKEATIAGTTKNKAGQYVFTYDGKKHTFKAADVVIPGLTQGVDYEVLNGSDVADKDDILAQGTDVEDFNGAKIKIKGINKYNSEPIELPLVMEKKEINTKDFSITAKADKDRNIFVTIKMGDKELVECDGEAPHADYEVTAVNWNKKTVTIYGCDDGNFTTAEDAQGVQQGLEVSFTQSSKKLIDAADIEVVDAQGDKQTEWDWTGKQITPSVKVVYEGTVLVKGTDYTVTYGANKDSGDKAGTVTITGKGDYEGTVTKTFKINGTDISGSFELAPMSDVSYDDAKAGKGKQTAKLVYRFTGSYVPDSVTYEVRYFSDSSCEEQYDITDDKAFAEFVEGIKANNYWDTVYVKAYGTGAYDGETAYEKYDIISYTTFEVEPIDNQKYTGKAITPEVMVYDYFGSTLLVEGRDYTVAYENNVTPGVGYAIVTGKGDYVGKMVIPFNIVGQMDQDVQLLAAQIRDIQNRTLNSKATTVKFEAGKAPKTAVTYTSSDENVVKVDENGNITYTGLGEATITVKAVASDIYKAAEVTMTVKVGLAKPSFTPFSKNNAFTLTSSTVKGAEKFEVEYATKKDFSNSKTKTFTTTSAGKVRQVKVSAGDKKTYYVRVRAISGTTKSAWSATKTVATK